MQTAVTSETVSRSGFAPPADAVSSSASSGVSAGLRRYAWFVVGWNIAVILWGAVVRATGSGAGCGNHWPLCNGEVIPTSPRTATIIEFTHRMMTGGATFTILGLLIWTFLATPKRHLARAAAVASTVLLLNEALLGALLVKLGYVVNNQSTGRFIVLPIHLANTLLLLAALALTAHFLARESGFMNGSVEYRFAGLSIIGLAATIAVGVTGSLAALGDTLFPAATLAQAWAQDMSQASPWLLRLRWMHPAASVIAGVFVIGLFWVSGTREDAVNKNLANWTIGLLLSQLALGAVDVLLRAPNWMQILHLLGADIYWVSLIVLTARIVVVPLGCPGGFCKLGFRI
jgi:heme a synthase